MTEFLNCFLRRNRRPDLGLVPPVELAAQAGAMRSASKEQHEHRRS